METELFMCEHEASTWLKIESGLKKRSQARGQGLALLVLPCSGQEIQVVSQLPKSTLAYHVVMKVSLLRKRGRIYFMQQFCKLSLEFKNM